MFKLDVSDKFIWQNINPDDVRFISRNLPFEYQSLDLFLSSKTPQISRRLLDGLWLFKIQRENLSIAFAWFDFRFKGGSFSAQNSSRFALFLNALIEEKIPLIVICNSMGVRFTEGRKVFAETFGLIPKIQAFKNHNLIITCANGPCFGLGAVLLGMGHYSIASSDNTPINLTGPEVFKLFFGSKVGIDDVAGAGTQFKKCTLIDEIQPGSKQLLIRAAQVVELTSKTISNPGIRTKNEKTPTTLHLNATEKLIARITPHYNELYTGFSEQIKIFVLEVQGYKSGLIISTQNNMNNMINVRSIRLINKALKLFEHLQLPLINIIDTPGVDPRIDGENSFIIESYISLAESLINYPFAKIGVVHGRLFGGASILSLPQAFGGQAVYLVSGSELGVMHSNIVDELLASSKNLQEQWNSAKETQNENYLDLIDANLITSVIDIEELPEKLALELSIAYATRATEKTAHV